MRLAAARRLARAPPQGFRTIGAYVDLRSLLIFTLPLVTIAEVDEFLSTEALQANARIGMDGRGFAHELSTIGAFVRWFGSNTTAYNEFSWLIIEGQEGYQFLKKHLAGLLGNLTSVEQEDIQFGRRTLRVRFVLVSDYKMECILTGNDGAKERYFCFYCDVDKATYRQTLGTIIGVHCPCPVDVQHLLNCQFYYKLKTVEHVTELLKQHGDEQCGSKRAPLWPFGATTDRIYNDTLHWTMGLARCMSDGILSLCPKKIGVMSVKCSKVLELMYPGQQTKIPRRRNELSFLVSRLRKSSSCFQQRKLMLLPGTGVQPPVRGQRIILF